MKRRQVWIGSMTLLLLAACQPATETVGVKHYSAAGTEGLNLPFSSAVRAGNTIYLSGNIGNLPGTRDLAPGGIEGETRQTMENIKTAIENAGATMDDIVKCTVFIADMALWEAMNGVYRQYFDAMPARSAVGASGIALNALVEIECIAYVSD